MQRLLGPYANAFNRHKRSGHLVQNRFKNTLVEDEPYLLELVRYLHINPVRSKLPVTAESLDNYRWTGHAVLLGEHDFAVQDTDFVLAQFGDRVGAARQAYRDFVREGAGRESEIDLEGGGLRRSAGGWEVVTKLARGRERWAFDERILGSGEFVEGVLKRLEQPESPHASSIDDGATFERLLARVARYYDVSGAGIASRSLRPDILTGRALVCYLAVRRCGLTIAEVSRRLRVSPRSVGRAIKRFDPSRYPVSQIDKLLAD